MSAKSSATLATQLRIENEDLRIRLAEAEETLLAIRNGEVDAIVVSGPDGDKIFSLTSAETPYRIIIEEMNEGAVVLSSEGVILYCNRRFAELIAIPAEQITGSYFNRFVPKKELQKYNELLQNSFIDKTRGEITYILKFATSQVYLNLSFCPLPSNLLGEVCIIATDISELKKKEEALRRSNETTEKKVIERTKELSQAINELTASKLAAINSMHDAIAANKKLEIANKNLVKEIAKREQTEEKLFILKEKAEESESRYRKIYEDGANGMVMVGKDFKFISANRTFCQMVGYREDELQQFTFAKITHPDDSAKNISQVKKMMAGEIDVYRTEKRFLNKNGQTIWAQLTVSPIYNSKGGFLYNLGMITNITEQKNAEMALLESESRFRRAIIGAPFPIMIHSEDGQVLTINKPWTGLTGYKHGDIPTIADWTRKAYGNKMDLVHSEIDCLYNLNKPKTEGEYTITTSSGDSIIWDFSSAPIGALPDGRRMVISMAMDVTERKKAELDLLQMSRVMENSQKIAHLGSFEYIVSSQTTIWSEEEYHIYGLDPKNSPPSYQVMLEKCIHPDDAKFFHNTFITAMENKEQCELEYRIIRPDGSIRWVYDHAEPEFDEYGKVLRYVGATLDITERKQLHEELEILNAELEIKVKQRTALLEASNKELEAFTYSVSHDLRAPLRHINGYVELLNLQFKEGLSVKARHYLETISGASGQMGTLIDELLRYSRTGQKEVKKSLLDFNALLKDVLDEMTPITKKRKITWEIKKLPKVFGDYNLLKLVWSNLLDNAIKYTRNQQIAKISVSYKHEAKDVIFCISDNGVGFDMKYAHKLFGVFQRLHSQAEFEGTGIGLAHVQRIIHKHLGRVWAEAEPGKGAKFYFSLPINLEEVL